MLGIYLYLHAGARTALSSPSNANAQQIAFSTTSETTDRTSAAVRRSPLKKEYKAMLLEEREKNDTLTKKVEESGQVLEAKVKKISTLKKELRYLSDSLRAEKAKSRMTILKLVDDVEDAISDSIEVKDRADQKMSASELAVCKEKEKAQHAIKREREYNSYIVASCKFILIELRFLHFIITHVTDYH